MRSTEDLRGVFFSLIFGRQSSGYVCLATLDRRINKKDRKLHEEYYSWPSDVDKMVEASTRHSEAGVDVYFCPQLLNAKKRNKESVKCCTNIWSDLDTCSPDSMIVTPSIVLETSAKRYQAFWVLEDMVPPHIAEGISKRVAYYHSGEGADKSGWDLSQLLRVPLTDNYKYRPPGRVAILSSSRRAYRPEDFSSYPEARGVEFQEMPNQGELPEDTPEEILERYRRKLNPKVFHTFSTVPEGTWSETLWQFELQLYEAGLSREEVFVVAWDAACNKFKRDARPKAELWKEIGRAYQQHMENINVVVVPETVIAEVMTKEEARAVEQDETFVERYIEWASGLGDAAVQYHQAGAFVILSALLAGRVTLETSFGRMLPNLWFMILADTCQPLTSKVLTPTGWTTISVLQEGDFVIGSNGYPTRILATSNIRNDKVFRINFRDGTEVECTEDHLWTVKIDGYVRTVPLSDLRRRINSGKGRNIGIPTIINPVEFISDSVLPVHPYLLGIWLGEGCRSESYAQFASDGTTAELVNEILPSNLHLVNSKSKDESWKSWTFSIRPNIPRGPNSVRDGLRTLGLLATYSRERFIPEVYKYSLVEDRVALLQGILDGEGHCTKSGNVKMDSTSKELIDDTIDLIRSLGGIAQVNGPRKAKSGSAFWTLTFTPPKGLIPFRIKSKAARVKGSGWTHKGIKSIEEVGVLPVRCIKVSAADGLYVTDGFTVTHNTLTRKSTAMEISVDLLAEVDPDAIMATADGSVEGLLSGLATRPGRASIFLRDEVTGLIESMTKKDYMAGTAELLTKLYDGRSQKRLLRKDTIEVKDPVLIFLAGGIRTKMQSLVTLEHVASGFLPRFIFLTAISDMSKVKPLGPPTERDLGNREVLLDEMRDIVNRYHTMQETVIKQTGVTIPTPRKWRARLSDEAWQRFAVYEIQLLTLGVESERPDILTPVYDRLAKSALKAAVLLAAAESKDEEVTVELRHLLKAMWYARKWQEYAVDIINGVGKTVDEREIERILSTIKKHPDGVGRGKLMQSYHLSATRAAALFQTLEQRGLVYSTNFGRGLLYHASKRD